MNKKTIIILTYQLLLPWYHISSSLLYQRTMDILPEAFGMLTFLGLWKSDKWEVWKRILYYCYTLLIAYHIIFLIFSGTMGLIVFSTNIIDIINDSANICTAIPVLWKMNTIIGHRKNIISMVSMLQTPDFQSKDYEEWLLKDRCQKSIRFYTYVYLTFVATSVIIFHTLYILVYYQKGTLPYNAWFPYNISSIRSFTCYQQAITVIFYANINSAYDSLLLGIVVHICLQVNILKYRFRKMVNDLQRDLSARSDANHDEYQTVEKKLITEFVSFQNAVFKLVRSLTDTFAQTMLVQFGSSASILCTSMYVLSQTPVFSSDFLACFLYISCMFCQIFFPCMIGNQMTLEFGDLNDAMYNTNWYAVSNNFRKCMNIIMTKSSKPIVFSSGHVISLSLEAFKSLSKLSYSIFNVFQQVS